MAKKVGIENRMKNHLARKIKYYKTRKDLLIKLQKNDEDGIFVWTKTAYVDLLNLFLETYPDIDFKDDIIAEFDEHIYFSGDMRREISRSAKQLELLIKQIDKRIEELEALREKITFL